MSAILQRREDPRDAYDRLERDELWDLSKANGVTYETSEAETTSEMMRKKLRALGIKNFMVPPRELGEYKTREPFQIIGKTVEAPKPVVVPVDKPVAQMSIQELRRECRRLGIKLSRTDNLDRLREKLNGHSNAA